MDDKTDALEKTVERLAREPRLARQLALSTEFSTLLLEFQQKPQQLDSRIGDFFGKLLRQVTLDFVDQTCKRVGCFLAVCALIRHRGAQFSLQFIPNDVQLLLPVVYYFYFLETIDLDALRGPAQREQRVGALNFDIVQDTDYMALKQQMQQVVFAFLQVLALTPLALDSLGDFLPAVRENCVKCAALGNKLSQAAMDVLARFSVRMDTIESFGREQCRFFSGIVRYYESQSKATLISAIQFFNFCMRYCEEGRRSILEFPDSSLLGALYQANSQLLRKALLIYSARRAQLWLGRSYRNMRVSAMDELHGFYVPVDFDVCIDILLQALVCDAQEVRELAAVQLGDLASKLPRLFCNELFDAAVEFLQPGEPPERQSGALLFIGELLRRVMIDGDQLRAVVGILASGLRATGRGSGQIKDSACYCFWCIARGYSDAELLPLRCEMQNNLIPVTCFDPDAMIRRAACAAYHELCGRHPAVFAHGAETCALLDYYTIGSHASACRVAAKVLSYLPDIKPALSGYILDIYYINQNIAQRYDIAEAFAAVADSSQQQLLVYLSDAAESWPEFLGALQLLSCTGTLTNVDVLEIATRRQKQFTEAPEARIQYLQVVSELLEANFESLQKEGVKQFIYDNLQFSIDFLFKDLSVASAVKQFTNNLIQLGHLLQCECFDFTDLSACTIVRLQFCADEYIARHIEEVVEYCEHFVLAFVAPECFSQRIMLLETLQHIIPFLKDQHTYEILKILTPCLSDYAADHRGDVGAQTRMRAFLVLADLNARFRCDFAYKHYFIEQCCARIEVLRIQAVRRVFRDIQAGLIDLNVTPEELNALTGLLTLQQSLAQRYIFDLSERDEEENALFLQQADCIIIQKSFQLVETCFMRDVRFQRHCVAAMIMCFGMATPDDEARMLDVFSRVDPAVLCDAILSCFSTPVASVGRAEDAKDHTLPNAKCQQSPNDPAPLSAYSRALKLSATLVLAQLLLGRVVNSCSIDAATAASISAAVRVKGAQLQHVKAVGSVLGFLAQHAEDAAARRAALIGLRKLLSAKAARWREIACAQFVFLDEERLARLCAFDFEESSASACAGFVDAFDFGIE